MRSMPSTSRCWTSAVGACRRWCSTTLAGHDPSGPQALFGPVLIDPPTGDDAVALWHAATAWLRFPHLYELQRPKRPADLEAIADASAPTSRPATGSPSRRRPPDAHPRGDRPDGAAARAEWAAIDELCAPLTETDWATPTCLPGWTVQDQLAHIAGIEMMLDGVDAPEVDVSHLTHLRNDVARHGRGVGRRTCGRCRARGAGPIPGGHRSPGRRTRRDDPGATSMRRRGRRSARTRPTDGSCGSATTTASCTSTTCAMRSAHPTGPSGRPSTSALTESVRRSATSSAARPRCPTARACASISPVRSCAPTLVVVDGRAAMVDHLDGEPNITLSMPDDAVVPPDRRPHRAGNPPGCGPGDRRRSRWASTWSTTWP